MTRQGYIAALEKELRKLPPEEIAAATEYYEEYFDEVLEAMDTQGLSEEEIREMHEQKESELIRELGSPKSVATQIKSDYAARVLEGETEEKPSVGNRISAVWWVILGICSAPVSIPLAIAIACIAFALVVGALSIIVSIFSGIIAAGISGIALVIGGFASFGAAAVSTGFIFLGVGLILIAAAAAGGVGFFIGIKALVSLLARQVKKSNENRKRNQIRKMKEGVDHERA